MSVLQAVKWAGDVVDNEHMNKKSSKSEPSCTMSSAWGCSLSPASC